MRSFATIEIAGKELTTEFYSLILFVSIKDAAGAESDTCEIVFDNSDFQIALPDRGDKIKVILSRDDMPEAVSFEGVIDEPRSRGSRGGGAELIVQAKAADMRGKLKARKEKHKDNATFEEAAKSFAPEGVTVKISGDLGPMRRDYWYMGRENFMHWGKRTAEEMGATFKIMGDTAVFVPRNSGQSASGKPLQTIYATYGLNVITWDMAPDLGRPGREKFEVSWYDSKEAKWKTQDGTVKDLGDGDVGTARFAAGDQDSAKQRAEAMKKETEREKGGGSIMIDGNPAAQVEATCIVDIHEGISGTYRIDSVEHKLTRSEGFVTVLEMKEPKDGAGKDKRGKKKKKSGHTGPLIVL